MIDIRPALTPESWKRELSGDGYFRDMGAIFAYGTSGPFGRHGTAALCLHEQEFGFIREEIAFLERADALLVSHFQESISPTIEKIKALLPPEAEE